MTTTKIELVKLTAAAGKVLTNGQAFGREIYLGVSDSPDNWYEISETVYEEIMAEEEARLQAEMNH